ncbi:MAG: hypothetical protein CM15mP31_4280 [Gammaproteobacteria bacterium]|nr:MAG: hypothetical protein CM15mP31_4280 [Gammaproteobacteria bacterium]
MSCFLDQLVLGKTLSSNPPKILDAIAIAMHTQKWIWGKMLKINSKLFQNADYDVERAKEECLIVKLQVSQKG